MTEKRDFSIMAFMQRLSIETGLLARHLIVWSVEALVLIAIASRVPGIKVTGFLDALLVIVILATINALVMPVLFRFAARIRAVFFPFITFALNGAALLTLDGILPNWHIASLVVSGIVAGILTVVSTFLGSLLAISDDHAWQRFSLGPMRAKYLRRSESIENTPGFIFLEIDGLAEPVLREAIERGYAPTMASWLAAGTHRLDHWECDLSSQTGASQAGILHGNNENMPAFRWYDKKLGRVIVSNHFRDTAFLQERHSNGDGLLVDGGASRGNLFSGDAPDALFTFSTLLNRKQRGTEQYLLFYANLYNLARTIALFIADVVREVIARIWQLMRRERPRVSRGGLYPLVRAATTSLLRELNTFTVAGDMLRGVPAVYTTYLAYDEVAHHSGIARGDTLRVLRDLDRDIGRLAMVAAEAPRPYHLVVLSDHGQSQGETFLQHYGCTLQTLVEESISAPSPPVAPGRAFGSTESDEGWQTLSALLTDVLARDEKTPRLVRRALRKQRSDVDGAIHVGPEDQERSLTGSPDGQAGPSAGSPSNDVVVLASGCLGLISFPGWRHRMHLEEIEDAFPALVPALLNHPGIGFIVVATADRGALVLGGEGVYVLDEDRWVGKNPLDGYGENAARHLRRASAFDNAPDILVNCRLDPSTGEIGAFEELVGSHGGLGGPQAHPFLLHPVDLDPGPEPIVGAQTVYRIFKRWLAESANIELAVRLPDNRFNIPGRRKETRAPVAIRND